MSTDKIIHTWLLAMFVWAVSVGIVALSGCAIRIGWHDYMIQYMEETYEVDLSTCEQMGSTLTCGNTAITFTKDDAQSAEATIVQCTGKDCHADRVRCDLAGCKVRR